MGLCFKIGKVHSVITLLKITQLWLCNSLAKEYGSQRMSLTLAINLSILDENLHHLNYLEDKMVALEITITEITYTSGTMGTIWLLPYIHTFHSTINTQIIVSYSYVYLKSDSVQNQNPLPRAAFEFCWKWKPTRSSGHWKYSLLHYILIQRLGKLTKHKRI